MLVILYDISSTRKCRNKLHLNNVMFDVSILIDFEKKEGTICVVSKLTGKRWEIVPIEASEEHPKARFLKLPSGNDKYQ